MKKMRILSSLLATVVCITSVALTPDSAAAAKKPAIAKRASVEVGKKKVIKVKNASKKTSVKWTVTKKSVARISKSVNKGKNASVTVKGIKKGTAIVKATIKSGSKKIISKCTVIVKDTLATATSSPITTVSPVEAPDVKPDVQQTADAGGQSSPEPTHKLCIDPAPTPDATENPGSQPTPDATENPGSQSTPDATENPGSQPTPDATENPGSQSTPNPSPEVTEYKGTFVCDGHAKITTYKTQNLAQEGKAENQLEALARDSVTGEALSDGNGQINFAVVVDEGYMIDSVAVTPDGTYSNLKNPNETKNGTYRVTKITGNITISVTTKVLPAEFKGTFVCDEHAKITTYKTQDLAEEGKAVNQTEALARDSLTGEVLNNGEGQINFVVEVDEGYMVDSIIVTPDERYSNLKTPVDTGNDSYRVTKISDNITISVTTKVIPDVPITEYKASFVCGEHASITTYKTQNYEDASGIAENQTEAIARDKVTGEALVDGNGQVNFKVVCEEGYRVASVDVTPDSSFKNIKDSSDPKEDIPENTYRVTKISGDITITVTIEAISE